MGCDGEGGRSSTRFSSHTILLVFNGDAPMCVVVSATRCVECYSEVCLVATIMVSRLDVAKQPDDGGRGGGGG